MRYHERTVALCGAPMCGKSMILDFFCSIAEDLTTTNELGEGHERFRRVQMSVPLGPRPTKPFRKRIGPRLSSGPQPSLDSSISTAAIEFRIASGAVFYKEKSIEWVLDTASIICYVFSAITWDGDEQSQRDYYELYRQQSEASGLQRPGVPWIYAYNKIDISPDNPFEDLIPLDLQGRTVRTCAIQGNGVYELWGRIAANIWRFASTWRICIGRRANKGH